MNYIHDSRTVIATACLGSLCTCGACMEIRELPYVLVYKANGSLLTTVYLDNHDVNNGCNKCTHSLHACSLYNTHDSRTDSVSR